MTRTFSDGHPKVLPACNFLSQYYFYNIFLQKSCRFSLQTLTKFEAAKTGSGVGFLCLTAVWGQHQESRPLASSNDIPVLNGLINTIDTLVPRVARFVKPCAVTWGAGSPSHNALRMNYIINCRLSRDILFVSGVHGVRLRVRVDYFFNVCR